MKESTLRNLNDNIESRIKFTDWNQGTRWFKLELSEEEKEIVIEVLSKYPKVMQGIEDFQTLCQTEVKQDMTGKVRYLDIIGLFQKIKEGSLKR